MGAWDYGAFDDDSAYDVMEELWQCADIPSYMEQVFEMGVAAEYLGYDEGIAVAVCGAVLDSMLSGTPYRFDGFAEWRDSGRDGSQQYLDWIAARNKGKWHKLKPKAAEALERLLSQGSEMNELWSENRELYPKWRGVYQVIIGRLRQ